MSLVQKARRPPWKRTRTRARLNALSRRMGAAMSVDLLNGIVRFKNRVNPQKVYDAWISRDYSQIVQAMPWEHLYTDIQPASDRQSQALQSSWGISLGGLPAPSDPRMRWDTQNPRIREFIAGRRARNFTNLTENSARNIQSWVTRSFDQALSPRQVATGIRDQIGLLPAHAEAVARYRLGLLSSGMHPTRADDLSSQYADRLLDYRAMMIGRTETRLATNQGQLTVWRQAADYGLVNRATTGKTWITAGPDPCDDCLPMDGRTVPLDSPWTMPDGTVVDCPPEDVHPHCYCTFDIAYDVDPDDFDDA